MIKLYNIDACHPINKRVIKSNLDPDGMVELYKELQNAGYEDRDIILDTREIYQEGDTILITRDMYESLPDKVDHPSEDWKVQTHKRDAKQSLKYMFGEENLSFPFIGKISKLRLGRENGHLVIKWHNVGDTEFETTNVYFLEGMGFEFEHPEFPLLPLDKCSDELLSAHESIIKNLIIDHVGIKLSEAEAEAYLKPVIKAMAKADVVFYTP